MSLCRTSAEEIVPAPRRVNQHLVPRWRRPDRTAADARRAVRAGRGGGDPPYESVARGPTDYGNESIAANPCSGRCLGQIVSDTLGHPPRPTYVSAISRHSCWVATGSAQCPLRDQCDPPRCTLHQPQKVVACNDCNDAMTRHNMVHRVQLTSLHPNCNDPNSCLASPVVAAPVQRRSAPNRPTQAGVVPDSMVASGGTPLP
jgi:hypothetical protein